MSKKSIVVSGGFDPLHVGHLRMMREAAVYGKLTVIINSDDWLLRKKGYIFMPWEERAEIIGAYNFVEQVVEAKDDDRTVVESLRELMPDIFANGGDRLNNNTPEAIFCKENNITRDGDWSIENDCVPKNCIEVNNKIYLVDIDYKWKIN